MTPMEEILISIKIITLTQDHRIRTRRAAMRRTIVRIGVISTVVDIMRGLLKRLRNMLRLMKSMEVIMLDMSSLRKWLIRIRIIM